jgi:two-component system response regulator FixJ
VANEAFIYVVDDDEAVRDSLSLLLKTSGFRVRSFSGAGEFLSAVSSLEPGCLIADVRMPEIDGLELQERLARLDVRLPTIVITGHGDVPLAVRAMKAGAVDFVEKPFTEDTILASVRHALERRPERRARDEDAEAAAARLERLSTREREVLEGLVAGLPNKSIAFDLSISPRTVEIHRARVMDKMQARSLSELVRLALAAGIQPKPRS